MTVVGLSDRGKVRPVNQDSYRLYADPEGRFAVAVLCDGMGGANAGEVASSLAAEGFMEYILPILEAELPALPEDAAREAAAWANGRIYERSLTDETLHGMGTTLVAVVICGENTAVVNIGDSRCYHFSEGRVRQVTKDHSLVQRLVDSGEITAEEARTHPKKNLITRAAGSRRAVESDIFRLDVRPGDRLLLCSDGLSNLLTDAELEGVLTSVPRPQEVCRQLVDTALERGAPDNVTVVLVGC